MILRKVKGSTTSQLHQAPTIGLVLDFFNPRILEGVHAFLEQYDLRLDARWSVRGDWTPEEPGWDGVIYGVVDNPELHQRIQQWNIPKISLTAEQADECSVLPDYVQCGMMAARELVDAGAASLFTVTLTPREIDTQFAQGVTEFARSHEIPHHQRRIKMPSLKKMQQLLLREVNSLPRPLGFCQPHASVFYSTQPVLIDAGYRIPEDVSMVVIDKDVQSTPSLATVPLTTVELNEWHRGFVAAEMLHQLLNGETLTQKQLIIPAKGITQRASTGHLRIEDQVVGKALSFMRQNFRRPIGVDDIVAVAGTSRRTAENRFRETFNLGIHQELTRLRIEEAKRQLSQRDVSVTTVAGRCGFSSVHYFSTAFKRETGQSPKSYQLGAK
ncbi:helix-turn-helix domain-containing protein [Verrucomicrobiaceae bacterium R5-34]|nr:helix-turn-helix domain-containing protein [Verrucomicrobiaceae bacterium R5-34]